jgi:hypothetical protein
MERQRDEAAAALGRVREGMERFQEDRATQSLCASVSGLATYELDEYARSREWWEFYMRSTPHPVFQVMGLSYLGDCLLKLGDATAARDAYQRALAYGIDSHRARIARARLSELEGSAVGG